MEVLTGSCRALQANSVRWNGAHIVRELAHCYRTTVRTVNIKKWIEKYIPKWDNWLTCHDCLHQVEFLCNIGGNSAEKCKRTIVKSIFAEEFLLHLNWRVSMGRNYFATTSFVEWLLALHNFFYIHSQRPSANKTPPIKQRSSLHRRYENGFNAEGLNQTRPKKTRRVPITDYTGGYYNDQHNKGPHALLGTV